MRQNTKGMHERLTHIMNNGEGLIPFPSVKVVNPKIMGNTTKYEELLSWTVMTS